jgi:hypothetical protein
MPESVSIEKLTLLYFSGVSSELRLEMVELIGLIVCVVDAQDNVLSETDLNQRVGNGNREVDFFRVHPTAET